MNELIIKMTDKHEDELILKSEGTLRNKFK